MAVSLSVQHTRTIDDLFDPDPARKTQLVPIYQALDITLENDSSRHMDKAFNVLSTLKTGIRYDCLLTLEKIITDQIKVHKNKISAKVLVQSGWLKHRYGAIPTTEKTCDDIGEETPQNCAELVKNCFKAMFG